MPEAQVFRRRAASFLTAHRDDLIGLGVIVALVIAFLSPALKDGGSFGGFDFDTFIGSLTKGLTTSYHSANNGDAVSQMVSWNALDWRAVHHGQFPLWNSYSVLGMPQFLNFESGVLSLPNLVSYLVPLRFAFLAVVAMKFLIAGSGTYLFARVVHLRPVSATFAGASFMFAGAFSSWITWPLTDVLSWTGYIAAFAVLTYRTRGRPVFASALAASIAFSIYGGFPEANVMIAFAFGALVIVAGLALFVRDHRVRLVGVARVCAATIAGGALAAPLWLPGLQVIAGAHRQAETDIKGLPMRALGLIFAQGYYGMPYGTNATFKMFPADNRWNYYESVAYVGVLGLVLAVVAILRAFRRPLVLGLLAALVVCFFASYEARPFHLFQNLIVHSGQLSMIRFERIRALSAFFVAVLAGIGLNAVLDARRDARARRALFLASGLVALAVGYLAIDSLRAKVLPSTRIRFDSLVWPIVLIALCGALAAIVLLGHRVPTSFRHLAARLLVPFLVVAEVGFLFFAGVGVPSYSHAFYGQTPVERQFAHLVGANLVALDDGNPTSITLHNGTGLYPNLNIGYGIHLFAVHDPLIPAAYFHSWPLQSAIKTAAGVGLFIPDVDSAALARRYGIVFVLAGARVSPPGGTVLVKRLLDGETLYRVPHSAQFLFVGNGAAADRVGSVATNGNGSFTFKVIARRASMLKLDVSAIAGWHATLDGRQLPLSTSDQVTFAADVPVGHHTIHLWYWPNRLGKALVLALAALLAMAAWMAGSSFGRRRTARRRTTGLVLAPLDTEPGERA